jgi:hypothetical protein
MNECLFSPNGGCEAKIIAQLSTANGNYYALLNMYQSGGIHDAFLGVCDRGNTFTIIFDRRMQFQQAARIQELQDHGAICLYDKYERQIRSQYIICPFVTVITGTYLYTYTSESKYAEVLLDIHDTPTWNAFYANWLIHYNHSELIT